MTEAFAGLLKAGLYDEALLGLHQSSEAAIVNRAREAAQSILLLLSAGRFR